GIWPLCWPVVPEVYRISAVSSHVTTGYSMSLPEPPIACEHKVDQGTVFGASPVRASRLDVIGGTGMRSKSCIRRGMASVMLTEMMVSSGVFPRSFSNVGAALSQAMATRAP